MIPPPLSELFQKKHPYLGRQTFLSSKQLTLFPLAHVLIRHNIGLRQRFDPHIVIFQNWGSLCRFKTVTKLKKSSLLVLLYWNENRIHLGNIKKGEFSNLVPPYLVLVGRFFIDFSKELLTSHIVKTLNLNVWTLSLTFVA